MHKEIDISSEKTSAIGRLKSYAELMKLRLSSLVVLSAILGYLLGPGAIIPFQAILLCLGGFLITGASNLELRTMRGHSPIDRLMGVSASDYAVRIKTRSYGPQKF